MSTLVCSFGAIIWHPLACCLRQEEGTVVLHGFLELFPFDMASDGSQVFRVLHEITGFQADPGVDCREEYNHSALAPDLADGPLRLVRRGDFFWIDLGEAVEL